MVMRKEKNTKKQPLATLFAGNLNTLRTERGLSMKRAAYDLGVAKSTWCQWERGDRFPPGFFLELLTKYFGVPPCRFLALHPGKCFPDKAKN